MGRLHAGLWMVCLASVLAASGCGKPEPATPGSGGAIPGKAQSPSDGSAGQTMVCSQSVTIAATKVPLKEVLAGLAQQSGLKVSASMGIEKTPVTVNAKNESAVAVLCRICKDNGWGLKTYQRGDGTGGVFWEVADCEQKVLGYDVQGAVGVVWLGFYKETSYNFQNPEKPHEVWMYRMDFISDLLSSVRPLEDKERSVREQPVTFTFQGGKSIELVSDHERTKGGEIPDWEFKPRAEFEVDKADIQVKVPFSAATIIEKALLPFKEGASVHAGQFTLTVERIESEKSTERDPDDIFKQRDVMKYSATVRALHDAAKVLQEVQKQQRQPTVAEAEQMARLQKEWNMGIRGIQCLTEAGKKIAGSCGIVSGLHSAFDGTQFKACVATVNLSDKPKSIEIQWYAGHKEFEKQFRIPGAPLGKPSAPAEKPPAR